MNALRISPLVLMVAITFLPVRLWAQEKSVRFASYNIAMNRKSEGALKQEMKSGKSEQGERIAEVIQRTRPDVLLLCEFDYDEGGEGLQAFCKKFLAVGQNGAEPIRFKHLYFASSNTGIDTGLDLDGDGRMVTGNDAYGFGNFPGQYAMAILSQYELERGNIRTFQKFLWKDMPAALLPVRSDGTSYYAKPAVDIFRLSSKSHWDIPINVNGEVVHFLCSHPTPPVFDGEEDKNGKRNHDEIRFFADYISPQKSKYIYDDQGKRGGLPKDSHFVVAGDLNADPVDGDSFNNAIQQLLKHPAVNSSQPPSSEGGAHYSKSQGGANARHKGDPSYDTGDFNDVRTGNMRIDYCLPSKTLKLVDSGVFWPKPGEPGSEAVKASDHRMVWIDLELSKN